MAIPKPIVMITLYIIVAAVPVVTVNNLIANDPYANTIRVDFSLDISPNNSTSLFQVIKIPEYPTLTDFRFYFNRTHDIQGSAAILNTYFLQGNFIVLYEAGGISLANPVIPNRIVFSQSYGWLNTTLEIQGPSLLLIDANLYENSVTLEGHYLATAQSFWSRNLLQVATWFIIYIIVTVFGIPAVVRNRRINAFKKRVNRQMMEEEAEFQKRFEEKYNKK